jgi:hypothetical protein
MARTRVWTTAQNEKRRQAALVMWRAKSRRDLFREIAETNGDGGVLLSTGQAAKALFGDASDRNHLRVRRLAEIGELPIAGWAGRTRRFRLTDVLALLERVKQEAA